MAETMGERFKRLQEAANVSPEGENADQFFARMDGLRGVDAMARDPAFADYVLGLEQQEARSQRHISDCHERINDLHSQLTAARERIAELEGMHGPIITARPIVTIDGEGRANFLPPSDAEGR